MPLSNNIFNFLSGTDALGGDFASFGDITQKKDDKATSDLFARIIDRQRASSRVPENEPQIKEDAQVPQETRPKSAADQHESPKLIRHNRRDVSSEPAAPQVTDISPEELKKFGLSDDDIAVLGQLDFEAFEIVLTQILQLAPQSQEILEAHMTFLRSQAQKLLQAIQSGQLNASEQTQDLLALWSKTDLSVTELIDSIGQLEQVDLAQLMAILQEAHEKSIVDIDLDGFTTTLTSLSVHHYVQEIVAWQQAVNASDSEQTPPFPELPNLLSDSVFETYDEASDFSKIISSSLSETLDLVQQLGSSLDQFVSQAKIVTQQNTTSPIASLLASLTAQTFQRTPPSPALSALSQVSGTTTAQPLQILNAEIPKKLSSTAYATPVPTPKGKSQNTGTVATPQNLAQIVGTPQMLTSQNVTQMITMPLNHLQQSGGSPIRLQHVIQLQASQAAHQVTMAVSRMKNPNGSSKFTMRLDPPELGRVQVRMNIENDGRTNLRVIADTVETASMLQRESSLLQRTLQEQGLKISARDLTIETGSAGQDNSFKNGRNGNTSNGPGSHHARGQVANGAVMGEHNVSLNHLFADDRVSYLA